MRGESVPPTPTWYFLLMWSGGQGAGGVICGNSQKWTEPFLFFIFNSTCEAATGPELRKLNGQEKKERGWGGGV